MSRKSAREWVVKFIYQLSINDNYTDFDLDAFCTHYEIDEKDKEFIIGSVDSIISNLEVIDRIIEKNLIGWNLNRLFIIDKAILRVATNEIMFSSSIPNKVAINEAVEIAKKYSSEDSFRFINGVLGSVSKSVTKDD